MLMDRVVSRTILVYSGIFTFLVDAYPTFAASALAANSFMRSSFGGIFPLFGIQSTFVHVVLSILIQTQAPDWIEGLCFACSADPHLQERCIRVSSKFLLFRSPKPPRTILFLLNKNHVEDHGY